MLGQQTSISAATKKNTCNILVLSKLKSEILCGSKIIWGGGSKALFFPSPIASFNQNPSFMVMKGRAASHVLMMEDNPSEYLLEATYKSVSFVCNQLPFLSSYSSSPSFFELKNQTLHPWTSLPCGTRNVNMFLKFLPSVFMTSKDSG